MVREVCPQWSSIKRDQSLHFQSFVDSLFRPSAFPRLLNRVPKLSLSEGRSNAILEELDEPPCSELFHRFDFSTLDAKRTFEHTKVVQIFTLQDVRAMRRQNDHENPHRCTNLKHLVDGMSVTSIAYHHGRVLRRQVGNAWREVILEPGRECESVERTFLRSSYPLGLLTCTRRRISDSSRDFKTIFNIRLLRAHEVRRQRLAGEVSTTHDGC
mmetsp:Transcript_1845/g.5894  ORF Transcript_1845/g.5894 Transcript_1845/m.5894 type:complete len:213 (+) Transcript_1845:965-1603(+)